MRIFLTGAGGFIGGALLPMLGQHEVLCLARTPLSRPAPRSAHLLHGSLDDPAPWRGEVERFRPDVCVHLAWDGLPDYSLGRCRSNLDAGLKLLDVLAQARVGRIVVAGSCWEYGTAQGAMAEGQGGGERNLFAATKHALRGILESAARDDGMEWRWARIFFAYGPGQRSTSLIPSCHAAFAAGRTPAIREPAAAQDFIHVGDVAAGLLALTETAIASGIYNLGSGEATAVGTLANRVAAHCGSAPPYPDSAPANGFWADPAKMTAATGWRPRIPLGAGVTETLRTLDGRP